MALFKSLYRFIDVTPSVACVQRQSLECLSPPHIPLPARFSCYSDTCTNVYTFQLTSNSIAIAQGRFYSCVLDGSLATSWVRLTSNFKVPCPEWTRRFRPTFLLHIWFRSWHNVWSSLFGRYCLLYLIWSWQLLLTIKYRLNWSVDIYNPLTTVSSNHSEQRQVIRLMEIICQKKNPLPIQTNQALWPILYENCLKS